MAQLPKEAPMAVSIAVRTGMSAWTTDRDGCCPDLSIARSRRPDGSIARINRPSGWR